MKKIVQTTLMVLFILSFLSTTPAYSGDMVPDGFRQINLNSRVQLASDYADQERYYEEQNYYYEQQQENQRQEERYYDEQRREEEERYYAEQNQYYEQQQENQRQEERFYDEQRREEEERYYAEQNQYYESDKRQDHNSDQDTYYDPAAGQSQSSNQNGYDTNSPHANQTQSQKTERSFFEKLILFLLTPFGWLTIYILYKGYRAVNYSPSPTPRPSYSNDTGFGYKRSSESVEGFNFGYSEYDRNSFSVGDRVSHKTFGAGTIEKLDGAAVFILFDRTREVKKLVLGYAPLVRIK